MKNIRGALFVLSLSIVLLFNSTTIAQAKALIALCKFTHITTEMELKVFLSFGAFKKSMDYKSGKCDSFVESDQWFFDSLYNNYISRDHYIISYEKFNGIVDRSDLPISKIYLISKKGDLKKVNSLEYSKIKPIQTQQVAKKEKKKTQQVADSGNLVKDIKELSKLYEEGLLTKEEFTKAKEKLLGTGKKQKVVKKEKKIKKVAKKEKKKTKQVAKKEPTQTQQVAEKVHFCRRKALLSSNKMLPIISSAPCSNINSNHFKAFEITAEKYVKVIIRNYGKKRLVIDSLYDDFIKYNLDINIIRKITKVEPTQTQIAKKEPKKKEKKVAKKKEKKKAVKNILNYNCKYKSIDKKFPIRLKLKNLNKVYFEDKQYTLFGSETDPFYHGFYYFNHQTFEIGELKYYNLKSAIKSKSITNSLITKYSFPPVAQCNSADLEIAKIEATQTQKVAKKESAKKSFDLFEKLFNKEKKKITTKEVLDLGRYTEFNAYPEGMLKEFKKCKKMYCRGKVAGKKVYEIFAKRGERWHTRHPGDIIHGMAWFEIFYLEKLRKNEKQISRYIKNGPEGYSNKFKMSKDVSSLHGLIKTNKGRIKMREALGLSLNDDLETVLKRHWILGDFLNKDKLKVKKVKINSDIKKRKKLLAEYKSALTKYKNKLEEERRATN